MELSKSGQMDAPALISAVVTALLALLGAVAGAWLSRRSEYEKWYRQEKTAALAEYIRQLHDTRNLSRDAYYTGEGTELERSVKVTEAFAALDKYTNIARLFLPEAAREELVELQKKLWVHCTNPGGPARAVNEIKAVMERIQKLVEAEFSKVPRT